MLADRTFGWEFMFLGANIYAISVASNLGISADRAVKYKADAKGTEINFNAVGSAVSAMRCCCAAPMSDSWKKDIEDYCDDN